MRMIVALDRRRGMARDGGIPWHLPTDQRFFQQETATGLILMGYDTYLEVSEPLHGRVNYVASRRRGAEWRAGFAPVPDAAAFITAHGAETVQNIGGAGLFHSTLLLADELLITSIDGDFDCDRFFPEFDNDFDLVEQSEPVRENGSTFTFQRWVPRARS